MTEAGRERADPLKEIRWSPEALGMIDGACVSLRDLLSAYAVANAVGAGRRMVLEEDVRATLGNNITIQATDRGERS